MRFLPLLLWSVINISFAQTTNYLDYHRAFNDIEALLVAGNFTTAAVRFDTLFERFEVKFPKDYLIAAQTNLLAKRSPRAVDLLRQALRHGVPLTCLRENRIFTNLTNGPWQELEADQSDARRTYLESIDLDLHLEMHRRYQREQDAKRTPYYGAVVANNFARIQELLRRGYFPGISKIGIDDARFAPKIETCHCGNSKMVVTLLHQPHPIATIGEDVFTTALERGELHPRDFAAIHTFEVNRVSALYSDSRKRLPPLDYVFNFPFGKKSTDLEKVNADRARFGIVPMEVEAQRDSLQRKFGLRLDYGY